MGTSIYQYSVSSNDRKFEILLTSFVSCGKVGFSTGTIYSYQGQHIFKSKNISKCISYQSSNGFYHPRYSSTYIYNNYVECNSSHNFVMRFQSFGSHTHDFTTCNFIGNSCVGGSSSYHFSPGATTKLVIKTCIFMRNPCPGTTYLLESAVSSQLLRNCYIIHQNSNYDYWFTIESCHRSTGGSTETFQLTHYSTFLCATPPELAPLDCGKNCPTPAPIPTTCYWETLSEQSAFVSILKVMNLLIIQFILI